MAGHQLALHRLFTVFTRGLVLLFLLNRTERQTKGLTLRILYCLDPNYCWKGKNLGTYCRLAPLFTSQRAEVPPRNEVTHLRLQAECNARCRTVVSSFSLKQSC